MCVIYISHMPTSARALLTDLYRRLETDFVPSYFLPLRKTKTKKRRRINSLLPRWEMKHRPVTPTQSVQGCFAAIYYLRDVLLSCFVWCINYLEERKKLFFCVCWITTIHLWSIYMALLRMAVCHRQGPNGGAQAHSFTCFFLNGRQIY